jgi:hypothetical protein
MLHIKKRIFYFVLSFILVVGILIGFPTSALAEDSGKIIIIMQPVAGGWTNIAKLGGISEASMSKFMGVAHDSINKIGGITVNK